MALVEPLHSVAPDEAVLARSARRLGTARAVWLHRVAPDEAETGHSAKQPATALVESGSVDAAATLELWWPAALRRCGVRRYRDADRERSAPAQYREQAVALQPRASERSSPAHWLEARWKQPLRERRGQFAPPRPAADA